VVVDDKDSAAVLAVCLLDLEALPGDNTSPSSIMVRFPLAIFIMREGKTNLGRLVVIFFIIYFDCCSFWLDLFDCLEMAVVVVVIICH
jgi:hypothetical protein